MSTYYFLVCDKHMERTDACSWTAWGIGKSPMGDSQDTLGPFIVAHHGCNLRCVSEHDYDADNPNYKDWTSANVEEMFAMDR